jgi:hypothetical protein
MKHLYELPLIHFFDFYLAFMFLASTVIRLRQYQLFASIASSMPKRWPKLLDLVKGHRGIFLTWGTVLPLVLAFGLCVTHTLFRRTFLSHADADLTVERLLDFTLLAVVVIVLGVAMLCFDVYSTFRVSEIDRRQLETYFDQAETWLKPWKVRAVSIFSLGFLNPRRIVDGEVRKALVSASKLINYSLYWMAVQAGLRIAFALALWGTYAVSVHF